MEQPGISIRIGSGKGGAVVQKRDLKTAAHALNALAAIIDVATCPQGKRGARCALHAGIALGIQVIDIEDETRRQA